MKSFFRNILAIFLTAAILSEAGCKKSVDQMAATPPPPPPPPPSLAISTKVSSTLGQYLVDSGGRALYFYSYDPDGKDHCTGQCQLYWPVFNVSNLTASMLGQGLNFSDFSSITSASGQPQLTYKGWPLYYFAPDGANIESPNQTLGDNKNNVWFVAKPDYSIMIVNAQLVGVDGINYKSDYTAGNGTTMYLTDDRGRTLYNFAFDSALTNKFTVADTTTVNNFNSYWPIYETDKIVVPSALDKTQFEKIIVYGHNQLTYKQWPLYFFYRDSTAGSNKGVAFPQAPNPPASPVIWPVATPNQSMAP